MAQRRGKSTRRRKESKCIHLLCNPSWNVMGGNLRFISQHGASRWGLGMGCGGLGLEV